MRARLGSAGVPPGFGVVLPQVFSADPALLALRHLH
jgi:hypothetical protein